MVPLCDHVYVPVHPHPVRKSHVVVSVSIFLTVLPGLAAWRNPSLIPLWSKQWKMFVRWWHSMFSLGYKFSELLSRLRMKLWSVDKVCPSGLPKFAYQDLRTVGYIHLVRETLVSVGSLKSLSVSSVCGNNLWGKMMKKQIWIGWIWEDSLETLSLNLGWEKDIWGGEGGREEIPPVQGFIWSLVWMRENNRTDNSFSRPTYFQDFTNIRVFSSLWASSNFTVFTKRIGKKMAFLESQRNKESL